MLQIQNLEVYISGNFSEVQCIVMARVHEVTREYG